jgi:hypothetical protein
MKKMFTQLITEISPRLKTSNYSSGENYHAAKLIKSAAVMTFLNGKNLQAKKFEDNLTLAINLFKDTMMQSESAHFRPELIADAVEMVLTFGLRQEASTVLNIAQAFREKTHNRYYPEYELRNIMLDAAVKADIFSLQEHENLSTNLNGLAWTLFTFGYTGP